MAFPSELPLMYEAIFGGPIKLPLQWETLKLKEEAERKSDILRRVAHCTQVCLNYPEISREGVDALDKARQKSKETGKMESDNPSLKPRAELVRLYPLDRKTIEDFAQKKKDKYIAANKSEATKPNPDAFDAFINSYKTIEECKQRNPAMYEELVASAAESLRSAFYAISETFMDLHESWRAFSKHNGLENTELELLLASSVNKILAFGGVSLAPGLPPSSCYPLNRKDLTTEDLIEAIQHLTIYDIRCWLERIDPNKRVPGKEHYRGWNIDIYLQSQYYLDLDERLAQKFEMQILNGNTDKTCAWLMIDESTIIVELQPSFPNLQLAFEITRPAAVLSFQPVTEESFAPIAVFPAEIETEDENIQIPGIGPSAYTFERFSEDYADFEVSASMLGLVYHDDPDAPHGQTGNKHILRHPVLYIRKPHVVPRET
ncbi:hypothetical protein HYFRA_00012001 [Hymenoscyphus fraxineus]|uniref:Uncharacterized protein n=1 Tax=Hymenoscyphus fraxineus TaxID=746836 RepID=A0A9N9KYU1_9HELO|nr:hypothetical protein HYFRA_00012001 [Hymenoscyphus fraxineus]